MTTPKPDPTPEMCITCLAGGHPASDRKKLGKYHEYKQKAAKKRPNAHRGNPSADNIIADPNCLACYKGTISINPQTYQKILEWHNDGHPTKKDSDKESVSRPSEHSTEVDKSIIPDPVLQEIEKILQKTHEHILYDPLCEVCHNLQEATQAIYNLILAEKIKEQSYIIGSIYSIPMSEAGEWIYGICQDRIKQLSKKG
jgi:hypothetical protein